MSHDEIRKNILRQGIVGGRDNIQKAFGKSEEDIEKAKRRKYNVGDISPNTGLQKQADGSWAPPKKGKKSSKNETESEGVSSSELSESTKKKILETASARDTKSSFRFYFGKEGYKFSKEDGRLKITNPEGKLSYLSGDKIDFDLKGGKSEEKKKLAEAEKVYKKNEKFIKKLKSITDEANELSKEFDKLDRDAMADTFSGGEAQQVLHALQKIGNAWFGDPNQKVDVQLK